MAFYPTDQALVLVKRETTRGTDAVPTASDGVIFVTAPAIPTIEYDSTNSERMSSSRNMRPSGAKTGLTYSLTIESELTGSGDAGTAGDAAALPSWTTILDCFDIDTSDTAGDTISPDSDLDYTCTVYSYVGGLLYKMTNCKGRNWSISGEGGQIIKMSFEVVGIYNEPIEAAVPDVTYADSKPLVLADAGLAIGDLTAADICASSFAFATNGEANVRKCINTSGAIKDVTPGKRASTFECTVAAFGPDDNVVTTGTKNIYEAKQAGDVLAVSIQLGNGTEGETFRLKPNIEITNLNTSDQDGVLAFSSLAGNCVSDTKDGDWTVEYD